MSLLPREGNTMVAVPHYISDEPDSEESAPDLDDLRDRVLYGCKDRREMPIPAFSPFSA